MQQPKLFILLKSLSVEELTQLGKFLNSPYFNNSDLIKKLFGIIKGWHPDYASRALTKEKLFQKVFSKQEEYSYKKITDLMSDLAILTEKFMIIEELNENTEIMLALKRVVFKKKSLERLFQKYVQKEIQYFSKKITKTAFDYLALAEVYYEHYFHSTTNRLDCKQAQFQSIADFLDQFFVLIKLRLEIEYLAREGIVPESGKNWQIEEVRKRAEEWTSENILFSVFLKTIGFLCGKLSQKDFEKLNKSIQSEQAQIPMSELGFIMIAMINRAWQLYSRGNEKYIYYLFEIYKTGIQYKNVLLTHGQMRPTTYANIVVTGCIVKNINWVRKFMEEYHEKLLPENSSLTLDYCHSVVFFHEKKFDEAHELLKTRRSSKGLMELRCRFLEIQIFYELFLSDHSYESTLNSFINSFIKYIKIAKFLTPEKKELYFQTMSVLKLIKRYEFKKMKMKKKNEIIQQIRTTDLIARKWLLTIIKRV